MDFMSRIKKKRIKIYSLKIDPKKNFLSSYIDNEIT